MDMSDPSCLAGVSEHSQQVAFLSACAQLTDVAPELKWLFAIPNGGDRNMNVAANLKAEGVKPGVADLLLPCAREGYHGFFVEMKNATGTQSPKQKQFEVFVTEQGYLYGLFHNWIDALLGILWYLDIDINSLDYKWIRALDRPVGSVIRTTPSIAHR